MACNLSLIRQSLSKFSETFTNCIDEQISTDNRVVVRTSAQNKDEVRQWFSEFACVAGVSYVVDKVFKEGEGKKAFREEYVCHHSNRNKRVKSDSQRLVEHKHKATGCKQRVYVSIQRSTVDVLRYEKKQGKNFVANGLIASITFTGTHNHHVQTADSGRYLPTSAEAKAVIVDKFKQGHGPAAALRQVKETLQPAEVANASVCPTRNQVYYLWDQFQQAEYGGRSNDDVFHVLQQKISEFKSDGVDLKFATDPFAIALVTPIMRRTAELVDSQVMFVDSTASCDVTNTVLTFLMIATPSGGCPIGAVLTQSQSMLAYQTGFALLKELLGNKTFGGHNYPAVTMTDDSAAEREAILKTWPATQLLLCQFHVNQAVWRWLQQGRKVLAEHRQAVMVVFRSVMYAETPAEAASCYDNLITLLQEHEYDSCETYMESWWERRSDWCCAFRKIPELRGHNTNNYAEANIRVFKDIGVNRVKQYNAVSLMYAIMTTMETFYRDRLLEFAHNRNRRNVYKLRSMLQKAEYLSANSIVKVDDTRYKVQSQHNSTASYTVDVRLGVCECRAGSSGSFCKHQCGVVMHCNVDTPNVPRITDDDRFLAAKVALGDNCEARQFYCSLRHDDSYIADVVQRSSGSEGRSSTCSMEAEAVLSTDPPAEMDRVPQKEMIRQRWMDIAGSIEQKIAMLTDANWAELSKSLETFHRRQKTILNASQLTTFFSTIGGAIPRVKRAGAMIGVQPTSKARRADMRSRGNRTLAYGRNAKAVQLLNQAKRRKAGHCIGNNIASNVSNFRKH